MTDQLNSRLLEILQHSLGVDEYGQGEQYRNHFVTGRDSKDWSDCQALCNSGYLVDRGAQVVAGHMHLFQVTEEGKKAVAEQSPKPPKISKSRRRYIDFLDADYGHSFAEWIGSTRREEWRHASGGKYEYRYSSETATGEWKPTKKEAKESHKQAKIKARRDNAEWAEKYFDASL